MERKTNLQMEISFINANCHRITLSWFSELLCLPFLKNNHLNIINMPKRHILGGYAPHHYPIFLERDLVTSFSSVRPRSYNCKKWNSDVIGKELGNEFFPRVSR